MKTVLTLLFLLAATAAAAQQAPVLASSLSSNSAVEREECTDGSGYVNSDCIRANEWERVQTETKPTEAQKKLAEEMLKEIPQK